MWTFNGRSQAGPGITGKRNERKTQKRKNKYEKAEKEIEETSPSPVGGSPKAQPEAATSSLSYTYTESGPIIHVWLLLWGRRGGGGL